MFLIGYMATLFISITSVYLTYKYFSHYEIEKIDIDDENEDAKIIMGSAQ